MLEFRAISRLSRTVLISLLERHARYVEPSKTLPNGAHVQVEWSRHHLIAIGQTTGGHMMLSFDNREGVTVSESFRVELRRPDRHSGFSIAMSESHYVLEYPTPGKLKIVRAVFRAIPKIIPIIMGSLKDVFLFLKTKDPATANRLRKRFNLTAPHDCAAAIPKNFFKRSPRVFPNIDVTVVIPIFNAIEDLNTLLSCLQGSKYEIIFIDDGNDDSAIGSILSSFLAENKNAMVLKNPSNKGFIASANRGIRYAKGHVILLNSDTIPPSGDWVARLMKPITDDASIATVTPFSNNAEIISIPSQNNQTPLETTVVNFIDGVASQISEKDEIITLPTGIGFCMAMNREFIDKLGGFDTEFGRGYGEEVDWCQKAIQVGGRNVGLASLFVGHKGGSSFGSQKKERIRAASKIISSRYPEFDKNVQAWARDAPAQAQKLALSIAWLSAIESRPIPVFIGHSMGGGAEAALQEEIKQELRVFPAVIVLRVGGPSLWRIELQGNEFRHAADADSMEIVGDFLAPLKRIGLIYSCGVGGRHPRDAVDLILYLFDHRCTFDMHIHDFFPISPSWNLLNAAGQFEGVPDPLTSDGAHIVPPLNRAPSISYKSWRALWGQAFDISRNIVAFSNSSATLIREAYPAVAQKITVRPHPLRNLPRGMRTGGASVGILGSLNKAKGAEVVHRLSMSGTNLRRIVVLGEMDGEYALKLPHVFHGRYAHDQISDLAEKYDIGLWFIPSICPETFSFATHEALATGLPVIAFARGAQGEAVANASNGYPIAVEPDDIDAIATVIEQIFSDKRDRTVRRAS